MYNFVCRAVAYLKATEQNGGASADVAVAELVRHADVPPDAFEWPGKGQRRASDGDKARTEERNNLKQRPRTSPGVRVKYGFGRKHMRSSSFAKRFASMMCTSSSRTTLGGKC